MRLILIPLILLGLMGSLMMLVASSKQGAADQGGFAISAAVYFLAAVAATVAGAWVEERRTGDGDDG